ncbi:GNAT family N-acetyltransferase [Coralloluteibacterium stylophorae]|uniref:GNAT family N-acetyltransferase n=1 Tax=Coralloluteibacterium stylophorae TaxID=1776034 RepID=A0A8J8AZ08_9GAMM|nr:GNAT family N-acetyltransferase [Coralloluteibacterium stylophorae]MBS7458819.1 GNAT family N-acetyltransferase [Coralloluteibacterium stylophorae]
MDSTLHFRDARAGDLPALLAIEAQFPGDRMSARQFRHHLGNPRARLRVAEDRGEVVGTTLLLLRIGSRRGRLYSIAVRAGRGGRGLGAALLADAEAQARGAGRELLVLEVRPDNAPARALYRRAGYAETGRIPDYYEDGAEALRLSRAIGP